VMHRHRHNPPDHPHGRPGRLDRLGRPGLHGVGVTREAVRVMRTAVPCRSPRHPSVRSVRSPRYRRLRGPRGWLDGTARMVKPRLRRERKVKVGPRARPRARLRRLRARARARARPKWGVREEQSAPHPPAAVGRVRGEARAERGGGEKHAAVRRNAPSSLGRKRAVHSLWSEAMGAVRAPLVSRRILVRRTSHWPLWWMGTPGMRWKRF
jgi:hypothetical protein